MDEAQAGPRESPGAPPSAEGRSLVGCLTAALPNLMSAYERLCRLIASPDVHDLGFFLSTYFCGPVGLYVWESRRGGLFRRLVRGIAAWVVLALGVFLFFAAFGWAFAVLTLLPGRPFRWVVRKTGLARSRSAPPVPGRLTFDLRALDVVSLVFIAFVFLALVANRDDLSRMEFVTDSDPAYHMAVARQIVELRRIPRWDRWEYAPFGRPHLYPPLLHVLIAFFSRAPEEVSFGFNTLQILAFPAALFAGWYFARWMFGAGCAFAALIFLSMETSFLISQAMVLPAGLVTALMPLILMAFLSRRTVAVVALLVVSLYMHLGMPVLVMLGLLVFSVRYREYFPPFRKAAAFAGFLYLPWLFRILDYSGWLGTSAGSMGPAKGAADVILRGVLQLQILNPVLLILAARTWLRDRDERLGAVKCLLVGFLPMLLSYGGRYFMHTWPLWAVLVARNFEGWLARAKRAEEPRRSLRRRATALVLLAFVPLPVITFGMPGQGGLHVSPGVTGADAVMGVALWRSAPDRDFERLSEFVRATLKPEPVSDEPPSKDPEGETYSQYLQSPEYAEFTRGIVHVGRGDFGSLYFADRLVVATGCRADSGGWGPEVRLPVMRKEVERARREDSECLFAFRKKREALTDEEMRMLARKHRLEWTRRFGERYLVGGRGLAPGLP